MPLIVRYPAMVRPGTENTKFVQNIDFAPTFLGPAVSGDSERDAGCVDPAAAGGQVAGELAKVDLLPLRRGRAATMSLPTTACTRAVQAHPVPTRRSRRGSSTTLRTILHELKNVYDDPKLAGVVAELKQELTRLKARIRRPDSGVGGPEECEVGCEMIARPLTASCQCHPENRGIGYARGMSQSRNDPHSPLSGIPTPAAGFSTWSKRSGTNSQSRCCCSRRSGP